MKFVYYDLNIDFDLVKNELNCLIIENPYVLDKLILDLNKRFLKLSEQIEIIEDFKKIDLPKNGELIISSLDLTFENRRLEKQFLNELYYEIQESELINKFNDVNAEILNIIENMKFNSDYEIDYDENFEFTNLFKTLGIKLKEPEGSFIEKFIDYSINLKKILSKNIFILFGCMKYFSKEDIYHLKKHISHEEITVFFIDSWDSELTLNMNKHIIDIDLCEI